MSSKVAQAALIQIIARHAGHGFDGVMRPATEGCLTYLLATQALDALEIPPDQNGGQR
jgi:hypothetical protein